MYNDGKTPYQLDLEVKDRKPDIVPKVGDKVKIKSREWYEKWKDERGYVWFYNVFVNSMAEFCSMTLTVIDSNGKSFSLEGNSWFWTTEMFEEVYPQLSQIDAVSCSASAVADVSAATAVGYTYPSSPQGIGIATWTESRPQITLPQSCFGITSALVHQDFFTKKEPELQMIKKHRFIKLEKL